MIMFFNVKSVREYLLEHGHVFTLRKKRFRIGNDIAVYGSYFKQTRIGRINIEYVERILSSHQLKPYIDKSGVEGSVVNWLSLAQKLSGMELHLYDVTLIGSKSVCVCVEDARESI